MIHVYELLKIYIIFLYHNVMQIEAEISRTSSSHESKTFVFYKILLPFYSATYAKISY